jgi:hypothetical protein
MKWENTDLDARAVEEYKKYVNLHHDGRSSRRREKREERKGNFSYIFCQSLNG